MLDFLAVVTLTALLVVCLVVTAAWLAVRRVRRSRPVARGAQAVAIGTQVVAVGTQVVADGLLALNAARPGATPNRGAALQALRISWEHRALRQRVAEAQRAGVHLGDVPALLPRLEAEGRRLRTALRQLVGTAAPGHALAADADRHLATLADVREAVAAAARVPTADETLAQDAQEAALGLRLHAAAYSELMGTPTRTAGR
jgi:hypothetical protein